MYEYDPRSMHAWKPAAAPYAVVYVRAHWPAGTSGRAVAMASGVVLVHAWANLKM